MTHTIRQRNQLSRVHLLRDETEDHRFARGMLNALAISAALWLLVWWLV